MQKWAIITSALLLPYTVLAVVFAFVLEPSLPPDTVGARSMSNAQMHGTNNEKDDIASGNPIRITISSKNIDLRISNGRYDSRTNTWSLSDTDALFAPSTVRPNNKMGLTFVYGHGTDQVFGNIGSDPPPLGTTAKIFTSNGLVFTYELGSIQNLKPDNTEILVDGVRSGAPRLAVQTCTGLFSEWRTVFTFVYKKVSKIEAGTS